MYKEIDENTPIRKPLLFSHENWLHADVGILYEDGSVCNCIDGIEYHPDPTHYMEIPKLKENAKQLIKTPENVSYDNLTNAADTSQNVEYENGNI